MGTIEVLVEEVAVDRGRNGPLELEDQLLGSDMRSPCVTDERSNVD